MLNQFFKSIFASVLFLSMTASANAVLLTFEDVPGGSTQNNVGNMPTYNGFNFSSTLDWLDLSPGSPWPYGAHSGEFGILNNNGGVGIITADDGSDFTFDGLWAKRWATPIDSGGPDSSFGVLEGYNNGSLVWTVNTGLNGSYKFFEAQLGLIDELRLGFGNIFLVDDIELNALTPVPLPAALPLLAGGLGLLGILGWRRKRAEA